jgi:xylulokinase
MPRVLGIDSSTSATKVEVRDADTGELVASGRAAHPPTHPPRSEQDPGAWWSALQAASAATAASGAAGAGGTAATSVAGQQHGLVVLDAAGATLRPAKLWNDTESAPDAAWLLGRLDTGAAGWADACGSVPVAAFTITKLSWLHRTEPDVFNRIAHVLLPHDWLTWMLTGELVTDRGDASGTGYWSPATGAYRHDLLAIVDGDTDWPAVVPRVLQPLDAIPARDTAAGIVACGTGDNMAAALGVGLRAGDVCVSIGTSGTVFAVAEHPTADPTGAVAGFADATGRFLPLVCTLNATKVTDTVARLLGVDHAELDALALAAPAGARGLTLVPYFDGERTPNRPHATGTLTNLRPDARREDVARAAVEGVVCGLLDALDALRSVGVPTPLDGAGGRLVLVGGGARSAAYRQVLADLAGVPVHVPADEELVARGACVQAAAALHQIPASDVIDAWAGPPATIVEPEPSAHADAGAIRAAYAAARG